MPWASEIAKQQMAALMSKYDADEDKVKEVYDNFYVRVVDKMHRDVLGYMWVEGEELTRAVRSYLKLVGWMKDGHQSDETIVSMYHVTRHMGGPEEGGWPYDNWDLQEFRVVKSIRAQNVKHIWQKLLTNQQPRFNRFSCANYGEPDLVVVVEDYPGESQDTSVHHYE